MNLLLIIPPLTQPNTPYPSTAVLTGFMRANGINCSQADIGAELLEYLFSRQGLTEIFKRFDKTGKWKPWQTKMYAARERYYQTINPVMNYLSGKDLSLAYLLASENYLPDPVRFQKNMDLEKLFGSASIHDKAKYFSSIYIEDISEFIRTTISSHFGLARYAEKLAMYLPEFKPLHNALLEVNFIDDYTNSLLENKIQKFNPEIIGFSVPFPGNLFSALQMSKYIKNRHPQLKIVLGGGFINTELRQLNDPEIFALVDFICLDNGELPLYQITKYVNKEIGLDQLCQTYYFAEQKIQFATYPKNTEQNTKNTTACFDGLIHTPYFSVTASLNPMHRLWTDGHWNKMTLAKGCYWAKCAFCDTSLPYICNYQSGTAKDLVEQMKSVMHESGQSGFHFVDEAAPPRLLKELALEILSQQITVSWWTNIRFEKYFTTDICRLLAKSGCIAVTGGLETASDRLLKLMNKGISIEQAAIVSHNFSKAGIMVHAYLMYGFPTQTLQETIDSLEIVRQFFKEGIIQSAFWHRFALTVHSPVYHSPEKFNISIIDSKPKPFANNEVFFTENSNLSKHNLGPGLAKSLYNYMYQNGVDWPLQSWFDEKIPATNMPPNYIYNCIKKQKKSTPQNPHFFYSGDYPILTYVKKDKKWKLEILDKYGSAQCTFCTPKEVEMINLIISSLSNSAFPISIIQMEQLSGISTENWMAFLKTEPGVAIKKLGLLVL